MKKLVLAGAMASLLVSCAQKGPQQEQPLQQQQKTNPEEIKEKMQWFADAKLGIFIHWGIYSVNGIDESWSFHNKKISHADYMAQIKGFTASKYDPQAWADLIAASGARYTVITTKHHDGVALWDTKLNDLSTAKATPAKRDVLTPFFEAIRQRGIKAGAYFSLIDWTSDDYPGYLKDSSRYQIKDDTARWERFRKFYQGQMAEVMTQFNPDLWWFDGDWEHSADEWEAQKVRKMLTTHNPNTIINGRLMGYGDYDTPEQNFPVQRPNFHWWELCMTINNNWGWQPQDTNWKTPYEVITIFADAIGNGGNMLLDIGPREDGTIPPEEENVLRELGKWNKKHETAIFGTLGGIPQGHFYGPTTLSKDSSTLYLFLPARQSGEIMVKGLDNAIKEITVVGNGTKLKHKIVGKISWSPVPGIVYINVPETVLDQYMTVLELKLDKPVKLYRGKGGLQG
ncbi:alpha-L-fucosidase [Chitinophaga sp.]|uniref:alpha-L-fucosidase n=1 Tax=Chitinophaga sp. TaxID=1869181 RepID=UPI002625EBF3|nr:alpha-L-fucosidase [uncultured Chitinophaga sp.]